MELALEMVVTINQTIAAYFAVVCMIGKVIATQAALLRER